MKNENTTKQTWSCQKCNCLDYEQDQFAATGGGLSKLFDVQNKKFFTISCTQCGYTELYRGKTSLLGNAFDFFTN